MGRQIGDSSTMVNSSIALLQERFKELQRVKEKRQEKELLKLFSESSERHTTPTSTPSPSSSSSSKHFEPSSSSSSNFQPPYDHMPIFLNHRSSISSPSPSPPRVHRGDSSSLLTLGLRPSSLENNKYRSYDHHRHHHHHQAFGGSAPVKNGQTSIWSSRSSSPSSRTAAFGHNKDVDTSLHL